MAEKRTFTIITCACGQKMKIPEQSAGKVFKCVKCAAHVQAPQASPPAPSSGPAPDLPKTPPADAAKMMEPVGQLLVKEGLITEAQLNETLDLQEKGGGKLFQLLLAMGFIEKGQLHEFLSHQPGTAAIDLERFDIDRELMALIPKELALDALVLPIDRLGKLLTVAMACPLDRVTIAELEQLTQLKVKAMLCRLDDIHAAVNKYYQDESGGEGATAVFKLDTPGLPKSAPRPPAITPTRHLLDNLQGLPLENGIAENLANLLDAPSPAWDKIGLLAAQQPTLAAALLRLANTTPFGMPGQVFSPQMALVLLQQDGVRVALQTLTPAPEQHNELHACLLRRSRETAQRAVLLAAALNNPEISEALAASAGLLHLLGALVFLQHPETPYQDMETPPVAAELAAYEKEVIGMTHTQANQHLTKDWRLPAPLRLALSQYLQPEAAEAHQSLCALLHIAALLGNEKQPLPETMKSPPCKTALELLGRDRKWLQEALN